MVFKLTAAQFIIITNCPRRTVTTWFSSFVWPCIVDITPGKKGINSVCLVCCYLGGGGGGLEGV